MPTILIKKSDTPGSVPGTANLTNLAGGVEIAVNTADRRVYSMNSSSAVIELGTNPGSITCADASFTVARIGSLTVSSVGVFPAGTVSAPAITTSGDTNTGIFFPAADTIAFTEGGTEAMRIDSSANVGIGTSSPGAKAEIYVTRTSSTNAVSLILNDNVTGIQTNGVYKAIRSVSNGGGAVSEIRFMETDGTNNNTSISFATQSTANALTERLRIDQNGNLGLGVTPSAWASFTGFQFGAVGGLASADFGGSNVQTFFGNNIYYGGSPASFRAIKTNVSSIYRQVGKTHIWGYSESVTANNAITITEAMTLDASGRLLVGNTSAQSYSGTAPITELYTTSINNTDADGGTLALYSTSSFAIDRGAGTVFGFKYNTAGNFVTAARVRGAKENATDGNFAGYLAFDTRANGGNLTEKARITSGGDFCVQATGASFSSANRGNITVGGSAGSILFLGTSGTTGTYIYHEQSTSGAEFWNGANGYIRFGTNNTERARIHDDGGTTFGGTANYGTFAVRSISTTGGHQVFTVRSNNAAELLVMFQNGNFYCSGIYNLNVGGTTRDVYVDSGGAVGYLSSIRASKTNIQSIGDTSWLLQLNPVTFNYRKRDADGNYTDQIDGETQHGLIAEDVEIVKPELCFYDEVDGKQELRGVSYSKLVTPMLKLIQQQQAAIAALEAKVAALEAK